VNGKHFAMATLIAVVLLTLVFIPLSSQVGTYNPWLDTNDDGKMDGKDIAATASAFGTKGDPTKTVYMMRMTYSWSAEFSLPRYVPLNLYNDTRGYDRVSIYVRVVGFNEIGVNIYSMLSTQTEMLDTFNLGGSNPPSMMKTYQVQGDQINIWLENSLQPYNVTVQVGVYATA